jgi:CheY-like chemotaxis protein
VVDDNAANRALVQATLEAARRLREWPETRDVPVVALSAAVMMSERQRAEASVFHRYLSKPIKVDELMATLEPLLAHKHDGP